MHTRTSWLSLFAGLIMLSACQAKPHQATTQAAMSAASQCPSGLWVQVLGSGGPELTPGRASSAYVIWDQNKAIFLLDAGGGSFLRFAESQARWRDLEAIFFSHFHADHSTDFSALVKASWFGQRNRDLPVFGPWGNGLMPSVKTFLTRNFGANTGAWAYLSDFYDASQHAAYRLQPQTIAADNKPDVPVWFGYGWRVYAHKVTHGPLPALAYRLEKQGHSLVYSGDTNGLGLKPLLTRPVGIFLAHNAIGQQAGAVARNLHMTPGQIGQLAAAGRPALLVLSHRMHRTLGHEKQTRHAIAAHWRGPLAFADDLDRFCIP